MKSTLPGPSRLVLGALITASLGASTFAAHEGAGCVPLTGELIVTGDVTICPGHYVLDDPEGDGVLRVMASGVRIELEGVTLSSGLDLGYGIVCDGFDEVEIVGGAIEGFRSAVLLANGSGHLVEGCDLSRNRKRPVTHGPGDFLAVWPDWPGQLGLDQIGNGIVLRGVQASLIHDNTCTEQQNGIGLFECSGIEVSENDCSNNEGWGIHLHRSNGNQILGNHADDNFNKSSTWCHTVQQDGCDTAALLLIKDSNDNLVLRNSLRNSGDGVFSAAQEGATHWGADRNVYLENDCSDAKHIGIESTFSDQNVFRGNVVDDCGRYGFWLGYSRNASVVGNSIRDNATAGISNESTLNVTIAANQITGNPVGIDLRRGTFFALDQDSRGQKIHRNLIANSTGIGVSMVDTHEVELHKNDIQHNAGGNLYFARHQEASIDGPLRATRNRILGIGSAAYNVRNEQATPVDLTWNEWGSFDEATIAGTLLGLELFDVLPPHRLPRLEVEFMIAGAGPFTLRRVVNERASDATDARDPAAPARGNAQDELRLGRSGTGPGSAAYVSGLHFRDIYLPADATILAARLVLPTDGPTSVPLELAIRAEGSLDPRPFEAGSMPATRGTGSQAVAWSVAGSWVAGGWATSPDLGPLLNEALAQPGWQSGESLVLILSGAGASDGFRTIATFDREGYVEHPGTPYEFRRYRRHRFCKLEARFQTIADGEVALERELAAGSDDADACLGCNEVYFGFNNGSNQVSGFRFPDLRLPAAATLNSAHLSLPTDGTYTNTMFLTLVGELGLDPPTYSGGDLPLQRPETLGSIPWTVNQPWQFTDWHDTPDLSPLVEEVRLQPGWQPGSALALHVKNAGSLDHRRVWAFERDPRTDGHDFPEFGPTPFVPFDTHPFH